MGTRYQNALPHALCRWALCLLAIFLWAVGIILAPGLSSAQSIDRAVASIDDEVITMRELQAEHTKKSVNKPSISMPETLDAMINRLLLLREARKLKSEAPDEDTLIKEYLDLKLRAFIFINEQDIKRYFRKHRAEFKGMKYDQVRDRIKLLLEETEMNDRLKRLVAQLRESAAIRVMLD